MRMIFIFGFAKKDAFFAEVQYILDRRVIQKVVPLVVIVGLSLLNDIGVPRYSSREPSFIKESPTITTNGTTF